MIPAWDGSEAWRRLAASRFLRATLRVPKEDHAWRAHATPRVTTYAAHHQRGARGGGDDDDPPPSQHCAAAARVVAAVSARRVPVDTALFFLQNAAGVAEWPCSPEALDELRYDVARKDLAS